MEETTMKITHTHTVTYKTHKGIKCTKVFKITDYRTAYDCLLYIETESARKTLIKQLDLPATDMTGLKNVFTPTKHMKTQRIADRDLRRQQSNSKSYQRSIDREIGRMVAHSGFMSNSPF
jgi:hypothetical protein